MVIVGRLHKERRALFCIGKPHTVEQATWCTHAVDQSVAPRLAERTGENSSFGTHKARIGSYRPHPDPKSAGPFHAASW
jgi:hypothetical protein